MFETKHSFCSMFQNLQHWHTFAPIQTQMLKNLTVFRKISTHCSDVSKMSLNFRKKSVCLFFRQDFHRMLSELNEIQGICRRFVYFPIPEKFPKNRKFKQCCRIWQTKIRDCEPSFRIVSFRGDEEKPCKLHSPCCGGLVIPILRVFLRIDLGGAECLGRNPFQKIQEGSSFSTVLPLISAM